MQADGRLAWGQASIPTNVSDYSVQGDCCMLRMLHTAYPSSLAVPSCVTKSALMCALFLSISAHGLLWMQVGEDPREEAAWPAQ